MEPNIGDKGESVRMNLGLILVAAGLYVAGNFNAVIGILTLLAGAFFVYEAFARWCVFNALIGRNTCPQK